MNRMAILIAPDADELQSFAASELKYYVQRLFDMSAEIRTDQPDRPCARLLLGLVSAPHIQRASSSLPDLSSQGHLLRRVDENTMILAGGSSAAVAWAVYELVERYGVRYLLHGDVFPEQPGLFHLPDLDMVLEPTLKLRSWRQFNDLPTGPGMWGLAQQQAFIRQLFKLKFNGIYLSLWPHHPFVDYEVKGIRRQIGCLLFGQKIPIDEDNIGREHLPDALHLDNPEFLGLETFTERLEAGTRHIHRLMEVAKRLGMHTSISIQPLTFAKEFMPLLEDPAEGIQLGDLVTAERGRLTNPNHTELIRAKIQAYLDEYGADADELTLHLPEHPQAERTFQPCWDELSAKYKLEPEFRGDDLVEQARRNYLTPGGPQRAEREFKSTISMLHFFDQFFAGNDLLKQAEAKGVTIGLSIGTGGVEVCPFLHRVLWPGATIDTNLDYTSSRAVRRIYCMESIDVSKVPASLIVTLQDDNIGSLPQVATENIHLLLQAMQRLGWRGYYTRYWPIGDLDPTVAYMARASWDASVTPKRAYLDHFVHVYGADATQEMCQVMRILEDATVILDLDFLSLFFPVLGIMGRSMEANEPMPEGLFHVRAMYEEAERILARIEGKIQSDAGEAELAYWHSRLRFAVQALIEKEMMHEGGMQIHKAREALDEEVKKHHLAEAKRYYRLAVEAGEAALRATASQVRDDSDRSSLAAYYHFFVREVREKTAQLLAGKESGAAQTEPM